MLFNKTSVRNHHGHDYDHEYIEHSSGVGAGVENRDEKTLNILLVYWMNRNKDHEEEFREWIDKARSMGKEETAKNIEQAVEYLKKSNEMLVEAKKNM